MTHVYLDHNATTPLDERVLDAMLPFMRQQYGNASSRHELGTVARKAIDTQLPDPNPPPATTTPPPDQIVLQVLPHGTYKINSEEVTKDNLSKRLHEIYDPRPDKIIFVKGDTAVTFQDVIHAMDVARGAGVKIIGIPPK